MKLKNKGLFLLVSLLLLPFGGGVVPFAPLDYSAGSGALPSGWTAQPANAASFRTAGDGTAILRLESAGGKSATLLSPRCETAGKEGILRFTVSLQSENRKGKAILYLLDSRGKVLDSKRLEMGEVREKISLSVPLSRIGEPRIVRFRIDATKDAVLQIAALKTALVPEAEAEREKTVEPKPGTMPSAWFAAENRTAECGWNRDGLADKRIPSADEVRSALEAKLRGLAEQHTRIDSITFSGDGEPTLNPEFPRIIDDTLGLRDRYYPGTRVSVLSNATRVHIPEVFRALRKVDNPIMKIDAPTDELVQKINRPAPGYSLQRVVEALRGFEGDFVLQTMFLSCPYFDSSSPEVLDGWKRIVRKLRPREIMVYTIDRPTPEQGLEKFSRERMRELVADLIEEGFDISISG